MMVLGTEDLLPPEYFLRYTKVALLFRSLRVVIKRLTYYMLLQKLKKDLKKVSALSKEHYEKGTRHGTSSIMHRITVVQSK